MFQENIENTDPGGVGKDLKKFGQSIKLFLGRHIFFHCLYGFRMSMDEFTSGDLILEFFFCCHGNPPFKAATVFIIRKKRDSVKR